jgi:hypothetical protein
MLIYIKKISNEGQDEFGKTLTKIMTDANVHVNYLNNPEVPTGTCAVCITGKSR